jgi:hypothetical protein
MAAKKDPKKTYGGKMFSGNSAADYAKAKAKIEEKAGLRGTMKSALKKPAKS